ncbi:hypothetical protein CDAR_619411 [Caerostris darwini]|uniref:Uncharacterized protein n=1 Tax=Caerostris darwini TaxID=1538125 RepID=A0AAV4PWG3_9ARAC|nr:hypothetical protein CDAR_619411 [Caerostris darwini]
MNAQCHVIVIYFLVSLCWLDLRKALSMTCECPVSGTFGIIFNAWTILTGHSLHATAWWIPWIVGFPFFEDSYPVNCEVTADGFVTLLRGHVMLAMQERRHPIYAELYPTLLCKHIQDTFTETE